MRPEPSLEGCGALGEAVCVGPSLRFVQKKAVTCKSIITGASCMFIKECSLISVLGLQ
jgi:hypothetical protein